jgi:hypothetical protein
MAVTDRLAKTKERLNVYYEAELAILAGQSYTIGSRSLTRANLAEIRKQIKDLENLVAELESAAAGRGYRKSFKITPRDL